MDKPCTLCGLPFPTSELNRYGECPECLDHAEGQTIDAFGRA